MGLDKSLVEKEKKSRGMHVGAEGLRRRRLTRALPRGKKGAN